jgi:NADH:ubiquinone oxidoreductase subunit H
VELTTAILVLGAVGMAISAFAYWQARRSHAHIERRLSPLHTERVFAT